MRTAAAIIALALAATTAAPAADPKTDAKASGKLESVDGKVSGTITIKVAPAAHEKTTDRSKNKIQQLKKCGEQWNEKLAAYDKALENGEKPPWLWLSRLDYRSCMDKCLAGEVVTPLTCPADLEQPAQQKPAGGG